MPISGRDALSVYIPRDLKGRLATHVEKEREHRGYPVSMSDVVTELLKAHLDREDGYMWEKVPV
jgi:hypothetical protein